MVLNFINMVRDGSHPQQSSAQEELSFQNCHESKTKTHPPPPEIKTHSAPKAPTLFSFPFVELFRFSHGTGGESLWLFKDSWCGVSCCASGGVADCSGLWQSPYIPTSFFIFLSVVAWSWITMCCSIISPGTQPAKQSLLCPLQGLAGSVGGREMFGICYSKMLKAVASWREKTGLRNGQVVLCPCFLWNMVAACPNLLRALTLTEELPFKNSCSFKMLLCVKVKGAFKLWSTDCVTTETAAWDTFCWLEKRFLPTANIFSITLFQCNVKLRGRVDLYLSLKYICWHFRGKNWGFSNPGCSSPQ